MKTQANIHGHCQNIRLHNQNFNKQIQIIKTYTKTHPNIHILSNHTQKPTQTFHKKINSKKNQ